MGRRVAAGVFSFWCPGLGQLYNAQPQKALVFFCLSWSVGSLFLLGITSSTLSGLLATLGFGLTVVVLALVDAVRVAGEQLPNRPWYSRGWAVLGVAVVLSLVTSAAVHSQFFKVRTFYIPGGSMEPTLQVGDRLVADMSLPTRGELQRGDVVLFVSPNDPSTILIKRIIGLPGETIEIRRKTVLVDGIEVRGQVRFLLEKSIGAEGS